MKDTEIHWLAGLLEGEGSFIFGPPSSPGSVAIQIQMTDEDVIRRVSSFFGNKYHKTTPKNKKHKSIFSVCIRGTKARDLMEKLLPLMGERRSNRIRDILKTPTPKYLQYLLSDDTIREIRKSSSEGLSQHKIAKKFNIGRSRVAMILSGKRYGSVA